MNILIQIQHPNSHCITSKTNLNHVDLKRTAQGLDAQEQPKQKKIKWVIVQT